VYERDRDIEREREKEEFIIIWSDEMAIILVQ
jgi:hypothetical protein